MRKKHQIQDNGYLWEGESWADWRGLEKGNLGCQDKAVIGILIFVIFFFRLLSVLNIV